MVFFSAALFLKESVVSGRLVSCFGFMYVLKKDKFGGWLWVPTVSLVLCLVSLRFRGVSAAGLIGSSSVR